MNFPMLPLALLCGLVLAGVAVSFFAVFRAKALVLAAGECAAAAQTRLEAQVQAMRQTVEGLASQVQDVQQQPRMWAVPSIPKPGLNLSKRSQALRMHRRGDPLDQIAAALDIPLQEVDLLLKVHRIVINSIG
jgi:UDP:flavonoid glycosyltransferase YjiC (YdhE family)